MVLAERTTSSVRRTSASVFGAVAHAALCASGRGFGTEPGPDAPSRVPAGPGSLHHDRGSRARRRALPDRHQQSRPDRGGVHRRRQQGEWVRARQARPVHHGSTSRAPREPRPTRSTIAARSSAPTARIRHREHQRPGCAVSSWTAASSSHPRPRRRGDVWPSGSTTAVRWWASTRTPAARSTASCGSRGAL